ncbi:hypothetical protein JO40_03750 [Treponema putidum]|nr:hypothetical protein JO40_03750 [Treponema putidum]
MQIILYTYILLWGGKTTRQNRFALKLRWQNFPPQTPPIFSVCQRLRQPLETGIISKVVELYFYKPIILCL